MLLRALTVACGVQLFAACSSPTGGSGSCELSAPPSSARLQETHGVTLLIFPSTISPQYSGCRSVWFSSGQLFGRIRLEDGKVRSVNIQGPDEAPVRCEFEPSGQLTLGDAGRCLPQQRWLMQ